MNMDGIHSANNYSTTQEQRVALLKKQIIFSQLPDNNLQELASLAQDAAFPRDHVIVKENDSIANIYIIVSGSALVTRIVDGSPLVYAKLQDGESIGLSQTGFFSETGVRTATVTSITDIYLLRFYIKDLQAFFAKNYNALSDVKKTSDYLLKIELIKQAEPFSKLSTDVVSRVAKQIYEKNFAEGDYLFKQGDDADFCYLLVDGTIEISHHDKNNQSNILATLQPLSLVGELALLSNSKRTADAKANTDCKVLVLTPEVFNQLSLPVVNSSNALLSMVTDRYRPKRHENISIHQRETSDGQTIYILKNPDNGSYYQVGEEELFIWNLLDGDHTIKDIGLTYFQNYNEIDLDGITDFILRLTEENFLYAPLAKMYSKNPEQSFMARSLEKISNVVTAEYAIGQGDKFFTRWYQGFKFLFSIPGQVFLFLLTLCGLVAFISFAPRAIDLLHSVNNSGWLVLAVFWIGWLLIPFHEMAHGLSTKANGREIHNFGIGWFWIFFIAFVDTSDMWLSDRWSRIRTTFAGPYCTIILASVMALIAYVMQTPGLSLFFWLFSLDLYINAIWNLDPINETDGYYLWMDLLDLPNLRQNAVDWLTGDFTKALKKPRLFKENWQEAVYWLVCLVYIIAIAWIAYALQIYIFESFLPATIFGFKTTSLRWVLPSLLILISFLSVYANIRRYKNANPALLS